MSDQSPLTLQSVVVQKQDVFWQDVVGDVVILDVNQGQYFGAEDTSAAIWQLLDKPVAIATICDRITEVYDINRETCEAETLAFIEQLRAAGLIELVNAGHD